MANINRDYLIINDVKKSNVKLDNGSMFFYITDKNTQNIFVNLVINISNNDLIQKYANIENAEDYTLTMNIVKPDNTYKVVEGKLHDKENAIFEFNLEEDCCNEIGSYRCELLTKCNINNHEEITTSNKLTYKVKSSVLNDLDDIVEAPEYPLVIQLLDKLSDIEQYEEDRRANELARQLAEEQRQQRFNELDTDMTDSIQTMDNKVEDVENRVSAKEQAVDKLIVDTKADIDDYKVAKDQDIDDYKAAKDTEINNAITAQDNKIDEAINAQNDRIAVVENNDTQQDNRLDIVENKNQQQDNRLDIVEAKNTEQDNRLNAVEAIDVAQNTRLDAIEIKNQQQDDRLLDIEKVNKRQDMDLKMLFTESKNNMIDVTEEGNSVYLQNSTVGYTLIDEIQGNTMVNCNKEADKEIILNGNINTQGYSNVTLTDGVEGGKVDVALEGNTMVNVCDQKNPIAITKSYTVETGNHVALQGEYDGKCRPVVTGNTLWIDNDTEDVLTAFDDSKNLRLQSSFEDKVVTQEMVDNGEEVADNLGKYKVEYKVSGKNKFDKSKALDGHEIGNISTGSVNVNSEWFITDFIPVIPNITYVISGKSNGNSVLCYNKSKQLITNLRTGTTRIEVPNNVRYIKLNGLLTQKDTFQIEEGDTATSYEPYKESTKTLYLNSPLLEGDTIEEKDDGIYHVHRSNSVTFDGSNDEGWYSINTQNVNYIFAESIIKSEIKGTTNQNRLMSNNFVGNADIYKNRQKGIFLNDSGEIRLCLGEVGDVQYLEQWLQQNPTTVVYELASPTYELIEQSNLAIPSYANGHLDFNTAVPVEKVNFLPFSEELTYLYANTQYTLQFMSDKATTADITLGGTQLLAQSIIVGLNKIAIITPSTLADNKLIINGVGANISEVVITEATDQDFGYFEGMKSVGECEDLEVVSSNSDGTLSNTQTLTHEPLRAVGDIKDKYVLIDGKWYIERNTVEIDGNTLTYTTIDTYTNESYPNTIGFRLMNTGMYGTILCNKLKYSTNRIINLGILITAEEDINTFNEEFFMTVQKNKLKTLDKAGLITYLIKNNIKFIGKRKTPRYEPIDYSPFTVYSNTTHISNNSTIPCNMTIKNTGYNCLLKPSTTYTVSSNLGLNVVTTPSTLTEDCLRFYDTDTSDVTTMKNVTILEGDYTTGKPIPSHFSGIESAFEQEYDEAVGKYKVKIRVQNEDASKENYIEFYINKPLRGIGDVKDKVYVKNDKVVVERNCASVILDGSDDEKLSKLHTDYSSINNISFSFNNVNNISPAWTNSKAILSSTLLSIADKAWKGQREGITSDRARIIICLNRAKLQSQDVAGFKQWLQQNPVTAVYQLLEPTYEEVEYNDVKLFIESFKNSTLFYDSNIPVTSKLYYSYSVPIVDTVAQTADISDQQDSMIIDLATQVSVMEMMLM